VESGKLALGEGILGLDHTKKEGGNVGEEEGNPLEMEFMKKKERVEKRS